MTLTGLTNGDGVLYLDLSEIAAIGAAETKPSQAESRKLSLRGGGYVYIHNTTENYAKLKHLLPADAPALAAAAPPVKKTRAKKDKA